MKTLPIAIFIAFLFVTGCNSGSETSTTTTDEATQQATPPAPAAPAPPAENPAHGEPGHVHDEAPPVDASTGTGTAPAGEVKLNPAHGEPGHRCDIAVGAPLPM